MKKNNMKNKFLAVSTAVVISTATALSSVAFAATTTTTTTTESKEKPKMPENMIFGKITAISKDSVTISVATMKDRPEGGKDGEKVAPPEGSTPPEKPANDTNDSTKKEKPNADNMFTLTGETKTINIASAKFGHNGKKPDDNNSTSTTKETEKAKTYADYAVGDYISIEMTDSTSNVAKSVREAFGGPMGGGPKKDGKGQKNDSTSTTK